MYALFSQPDPRVAKARVTSAQFATLAEAVAFLTACGCVAEIDPDGFDAADVFTPQGDVWTVEPLSRPIDSKFGGDYMEAAAALRGAGFTVSPVFGTFGREIRAHSGEAVPVQVSTAPQAVAAFLSGVR